MSSFAFSEILYDVTEDGIAFITLNRPKYRNAISRQLTLQLDTAFNEAVKNPLVRVIVLRANGADFSSGHDLDTPSQTQDLTVSPYDVRPRGEFEKWSTLDVEMCLRWRSLPKVVIGAVHGFVIYHATALMAVCDVVVAAECLKYMPSLIEVNHFPWELGLSMKTVKEIMFTQRFVLAHEAQRLGLVNRVVRLDQLESEVLMLARTIARADPYHLTMMKRVANAAQDSAGYTSAVRAALDTWCAFRWDFTQAPPKIGSKDERGKIVSLAPVSQALSGDVWKQSLRANRSNL